MPGRRTLLPVHIWSVKVGEPHHGHEARVKAAARVRFKDRSLLFTLFLGGYARSKITAGL